MHLPSGSPPNTCICMQDFDSSVRRKEAAGKARFGSGRRESGSGKERGHYSSPIGTMELNV